MRKTLAVLVAAFGMSIGASAFAGSPGDEEGSEAEANRVSGLDVEQKSDGTYLRLASTQTPSFSVFKLKRPLRLVVDVSNSNLGVDEGMRKVEDGVVSRVSLLEGEEEGRSRVRLIVGFAQSTHYDVRTEDNEVVIFVEGDPRESSTPDAQATNDEAERLEQLEESRTQHEDQLQKREKKYEQAVENLEQTKQQLSSAREEIERLRKQREEADGEDRERLEEKLDARSSELEKMERQLVDRRGTVGELEGEVERLKRERREAREQIAELKEEFGERLEAKRESLEEARAEIESLREEREEASGESRERLEEKLSEKTDELDEIEGQLAEREETAQQLRSEVEQAEGELQERDRKISELEERLSELRDREASSERVEKLQRRLEEKQKRLEQMRAEAGGETGGAEGGQGAAKAVPLDADQGDGESDSEANSVEDIRLETEEGESRIVVELDRPGEYKRLPWKESRAVMLLNNVTLPDHLEQTVAAGGDSGAVRFVSSYREEDGQVRMEAELNDAGADEKIRQEGDKLVWEFAPDAVEGSPGKTATSERSEEPKRPDDGTSQTAAPPDYPRTVTDPSKVDRVPGMSRKQLTIDLRDADVQNVLRLFSKEGGVNIIAGDGVSGTITLRLRSVPLDEAFLIVLQSLGLGFEARGDVIRVAPQDALLEEQKKRQEARQREQKTRPLEVFLMPVNYAEAGEMVNQVQRLLSPRGSVSVDDRTNTLIIKDLPENIRSVRELVGALDAQVPQVLIEARIVETNDSFSKEFGIQWGGDFTMSQGSGNPTGLAFPNVLGVGGGATDGQTPTQGTASNPNFAVNLPSPAGSGTGGAIGMTMGSVNGAVNLNLRLSAAEEAGRTKIISAPKILTLDNREATISQGTSIPISVVSAAGVQTVFVDATLELTVTPHVTPDGNVQMQISATKNEPDFQNTGAQGDPTIIRKQAETELLVEDGETTVIGGIYTRNSGTGMTGIPLLHQIPILGTLFKQKTQSENRTELLIFLTPRVVNRAEALGDMSAGDVVEPGAGPSPEGDGGGGSGGSGGGGGGGGQ